MKPIYTFVLLLITQLVADAAGEATTNDVGRPNAVVTPTAAPAPAPLTAPAARPAPAAPGAPAAPPSFPVQAVPAPRSPAAKQREQKQPVVITNAAAATASPASGALQASAGMIKLENPNEVVGPFKFENMHLQQFLDVYAELVNRTILRASSLPVTLFMTLDTRGKTLTKAEAVTAFETVMAMNGITVVPIGDKFVKVVVEGTAPQQGGEFYTGDPKDLPAAGRFVTQVVQLKYISTQDAASAIQPFAKGLGGSIVPIAASQTLVIRDYSENIKRIMEILEKIDTISELQIKPELIPIKYALATDIATVLGNLTASGAGVSVGSQSRGGLSRPGASYTPGSTQPGSTLPGQTQPNMGQTGLSSPATSGRSSFQNRLSSIVSRAAASGDFQILGETKIIADERTNSLLIFANSQDMIMIKDIIAQLDVVLAQVLIEAIIMEVSLDDSEEYGVSFEQQPKKLGGGVRTAGGSTPNNNFLNPAVNSLFAGATNAGPIIQSGLPTGGFSYFTTIGNSFDVAVTAAARDSRVNVLSRPRIQTSHAVPANLFVGQTVPYVTGTYFGGINSQASSQYQQKEVGITLDVLPLINPDGLVVMDIQQNIEQLGTPIRIDNNDVPTTTKRQATAKVAVRDRETIVLGGFISAAKTRTKAGVPYLKDIPGLGALFRTRSETGQRVELMVFLRPTVLPTPEAAAMAATDERDRLPGIRQGEFEIREEERKRNEQMEAEMRKKLGLKEPPKKKSGS